MSKIRAIAAVAENGVIGRGSEIPWRISEDFKHFKRTTLGGIIFMGRNTWESLGARPLPGRENVVITSSAQSVEDAAKKSGFENVRAFASLDSALDAYRLDPRDIWIIGGAKLYASALGKCSELVISRVKMSPEGDVFFPPIGSEFEKKETILEHSLFDVVRYVRKS